VGAGSDPKEADEVDGAELTGTAGGGASVQAVAAIATTSPRPTRATRRHACVAGRVAAHVFTAAMVFLRTRDGGCDWSTRGSRGRSPG
jgi:hypothetical protein